MTPQTSGPGRPSRRSIYAALDQAMVDLQRIGGLPDPGVGSEIWDGIWYEETHHSTAIEGNTLILKQVRALLERGLAVGNAELREYLEVKGYADAARWVYAQATTPDRSSDRPIITLTEIREIHRQVVTAAWDATPPQQHDLAEGPGSFRRRDIAPFAGGMKPPAFVDVPAWVDDWLTEANAAPTPREHPVEQVARLHAAFERIHPFRDGNGRTGRLGMNLMLVRHGYAPAIIYKRDRPRYLRALDRADRGDAGPLAELVARAVKDSVDRFLFPALAGPHELLPLSALTRRDLTILALRRAAEKGRLQAQRRTSGWYSTKTWVDRYAHSRFKRRG